MTGLFVFGMMLGSAVLPFILLVSLMRKGQVGVSLTVIALVGAGFAVFFFASGRPFGVDPVLAMTIALIFCVPAFLGSTAGAFLGFLLRRQDDRNAAQK